MINVNIRELVLRLNDFSTNVLQNAVGLCVSRTHYEIAAEHLLLKLLDDAQSDWSVVLPQFDVEIGRVQKALDRALEDYRSGNSSKPVFSPLLLDLLQDAWLIASIDLGETKIRSGAILLAFLSKPTLYATGSYTELFKKINRELLLERFWTLTQGSRETSAPAGRTETGAASPSAKGEAGFLARFCVDYTQKARSGGIDPVFGRDAEIRKMLDILARRRKNNPICVGEPGVGKTAVVEGLALRITEGDVPDHLRQARLLGLDMGLLEAGAGVKGEFENRLKGVIEEIKASAQPIILFIDEAHTLVGSGASAGAGDAANLLKPALARGELRTVAATTWKEYKKYFEKDPALARRFQPIPLEEPSVEDTILILRGIKPNYEASHKVIVRDDAIEAAAILSDRYISGRFLPDKAIDLLDTSCARIKINLATKPAILEDKERSVQAHQRTIAALDRDRQNGLPIDEEKYASIKAKIAELTAEAEKINQRWIIEKEAALKVVGLRSQMEAAPSASEKEALKQQLDEATRELHTIQGGNGLIQIEVNPEVIGRVVSDWTGIPLGKLQRDEAMTVINLEERLGSRIKGQDQALRIIAEVIKAAKAGIKNPHQPLGVFLLIGPSGVGKTETGLALADLLFGSEKSVITINMSEFQERHTVSRLVGSPPGYVGYGEGGRLTEAVRQKPYSVVLLDEVEKAHLDVMNLFYQVFDKGILTDGEGKDINFKNTILFLTSNLGSDVIQEMTAADDTSPVDAVISGIRPILSQHFKPALLARMTLVPYFSLKSEAMKMIADLKLKSLQRTLLENNKITLSYSPAVIEQIAARCTEVETGARNIEYILNSNILPRLSQSILSQISESAMPSTVKLDVDAEGAFALSFEA